MPFTVLEALSYGRIVFYNHDVPYVNYFKSYNELKIQLSKKIEEFYNEKIKINYDAIKFIETEFNEEKVLNNLIKELEFI